MHLLQEQRLLHRYVIFERDSNRYVILTQFDPVLCQFVDGLNKEVTMFFLRLLGRVPKGDAKKVREDLFHILSPAIEQGSDLELRNLVDIVCPGAISSAHAMHFSVWGVVPDTPQPDLFPPRTV